jgi:hypothetical protein
MPLDPNIIAGIKSPQFDLSQFSPMNAMTNVMKLRQLDQEGELNALTLGERKSLSKFLPGKDLSNPDIQRQLASEYGETGRKVASSLTGITAANTAEATRRAALVTSKTAQYRDRLQDVNTQADALNWIQQQQSDPDMAGSPIANVSMMDAARKIPADPAGFAQWRQQAALGLSEYIKQNKSQYFQQDTGATKQIVGISGLGGPATVVPGSVQAVTMTPAQEREAKDAAKRIQQEGQRIGLEGRRVAVAEENARRDKDPVFQQQMAAAKATGTAIAQGDIKAVQALPKIISDGQMAIDLVDQMVGKQAVKDASGKVIQAATKPHPGFQDAVGSTWKPGFRFIPGTDAATFQTFQDQIEGTAFLSAFESLKGGGAISEKEGAKATAARLRMKTASDEKSYMDAAREFQEVVRKGVETARRRAQGAGGAPAATGGANIDALLDKYK